jgi:hypothetical protein
MNAQEFFEKTARHLFTQGRRSMLSDAQKIKLGRTSSSDEGLCAYKSEDGCKCAAGIHIPDDKYQFNWEGCDIHSLVIGEEANIFGYVISEDALAVLQTLQTVHDYSLNWSSTHTMREKLQNVADRYELDSSVIHTLSFADR